MFDAPIFTSPLDTEISGDDPLGVAPANERMFGNMFPGVNNVVRYIRVYSLIVWTVSLIEKRMDETEMSLEEIRELSTNALERIQLAMLWRNSYLKLPELAGSTRKFPSNNSKQRLTFPDVGTIRANFLDPGAYRPSLTGGLGFLLRDASSKLYACTNPELALAEAFDEVARGDNRYRWLSDVTKLETRRSDLFEIESALDLTEPSPGEQQAFIARFFPDPATSDLDQYAENRWFAIHLALRSIELVCRKKVGTGETGGATAHEVRSCMARAGCLGTRLRLDGLEGAQALWAVLQVRQLQRLALDTLFCIVEGWLAHRAIAGDRLELEELAGEIGASITPELTEDFRGPMSFFGDAFAEVQAGHSTLYEATLMANDEEADVFGRTQELLKLNLAPDTFAAALVPVLEALAFCVVETANLGANAEAQAVIAQDPDACSLLGLAAFFKRKAHLTPADFVKALAKDWVVLRHFEVASGRSQRPPYKNRFRFVLGDEGVERFDPKAPLMDKAMGDDRLDHILILAKQCGILKGDENGYSLSAYGRGRLAEL